MKVEKVFDTHIVRTKCETVEWYKNLTALTSLERLFRHHSKDAPEIVGEIKTTITSPIPIPMLPGLENLMVWVKQQIMNAAPYFIDFTPSGFEFDLKRTWANKMYLGSEVTPHTHDVVPGTDKRNTDNSRGVAIFYLQLPEQSSDLVFIQDEDVVYANVEEGELIFHPKDILHSVTKHKSYIPRVCLVFEFTYLQ